MSFLLLTELLWNSTNGHHNITHTWVFENALGLLFSFSSSSLYWAAIQHFVIHQIVPQLLRDNIDLIHKFVVLFTESQPVLYETEHYSNFVAFSSSRFLHQLGYFLFIRSWIFSWLFFSHPILTIKVPCDYKTMCAASCHMVMFVVQKPNTAIVWLYHLVKLGW